MYGNWIEAMYSCDASVWEERAASGAQRNVTSVSQGAEEIEHNVVRVRDSIAGNDEQMQAQTQLGASQEISSETHNRDVSTLPEMRQQNIESLSEPTDFSQQHVQSDSGDNVSLTSYRYCVILIKYIRQT